MTLNQLPHTHQFARLRAQQAGSPLGERIAVEGART